MAEIPGPRYLVLNRFDDEFGEYHRFVDPSTCRLFYVTTPQGLDVLDRATAAETVVVDDLEYGTVLPVVRSLVRRYGAFDGVVGLSEFDVLTAARIRAAFGIDGWSPEFVLRFRDKVRMKAAVAAAGLSVPRYVGLSDVLDAAGIVARVGLPAIVKPRAGAASRGVLLVEDAEGLTAALDTVDRADHECEEYVAGEVFHVDGIRRGARFHLVTASRYVNTCLDFAQGRPLGSVLLDPTALRDEVVGFAAACLDALELEDGPFHLELMRRADGRLVFLEVGLRPGGAEVAFVHRDLFGVDLFGEAFCATLGLPPLTPEGWIRGHRSGGWALVPEPRPFPSRVRQVRSVRAAIPEVYEEILPEIGEVFDGDGGYDHVGGRFRLRGADECSVYRAVLAILESFRIEVEPVAAKAAHARQERDDD
ncbi:hypothetical protein WN990_36780 [Kitasatospora purpeofusca]|uniref:ATP-grasp domain-containing protein n=1 Tax=Kitasatospora purpeofusca TaxID=67352 RepID=UPI0030F23735